jgi:transmembrane sensor
MSAVSLADGTQVTLNTSTEIRVSLSRNWRRVDLERGEVFIAVAHDPARPFVVEIADKRVIAVGTQFSIRREHNDIRVAVSQGTVRVEDLSSPLHLTNPNGSNVSTSATLMPSSPLYLPAGSVAQTSNTEILVREHAESEVERLLSWRRGYLIFRDTTLADAVAEFNRYNVQQIVITDAWIGQNRIGGNFRANNTEAFLWLIQRAFPIEVTQTDGKVILTRR